MDKIIGTWVFQHKKKKLVGIQGQKDRGRFFYRGGMLVLFLLISKGEKLLIKKKMENNLI